MDLILLSITGVPHTGRKAVGKLSEGGGGVNKEWGRTGMHATLPQMPFALAALSGVLAVLSYPRLSWWPLIFVAFAPLLIALEGQPWRRRLQLGWVTGLTFTLGMQYWLPGTLVAMSGFPWWLALLCFAGYAAWVGLQWAIFAWAVGPLRRWSGRLGWVLTVPLLYAVLEWMWPVLLPFYASSALFVAPVLLQSAEWIGPSGVTWLVLLASCAVVHVVEDIARRRASDYFVPTAVAGLWCMLAAWGVVRVQHILAAPIRAAPTVALVQPNVTIGEKNAEDPAVREEVYRRTVEMTREAIELRPSLVVWPEGGFPFVFEHDAIDSPRTSDDSYHRRYSRKLHAVAHELGVHFVAGALRRTEGQIRNSGLFFQANHRGRPVVYDKRHLLWFGERVPFAETFPALRNAIEGMSHLAAGEHFVTLKMAGFRWAPSICYEAMFPGMTRDALNDGDSELLLNLTNDVWFGDTAAADQHLMVQVQRSIENRVWLIRSTNSGISAFVDPTGTIRARAVVGEQAVLALEVPVPALSRSFYRSHGDLLFWIGVLGGILGLAFRNRDALRNFLRGQGVERQESGSNR